MLISNAYAQAAAATPAGPMDSVMQFLPIILMFVVLYFLMIRPQQKKAKEHKALLEGLSKGDEIVSQGGIAGASPRLMTNLSRLKLPTKLKSRYRSRQSHLFCPRAH